MLAQRVRNPTKIGRCILIMAFAKLSPSHITGNAICEGPVVAQLEYCKYPVLRRVIRELGWKEAEEGEPWQLLWVDGPPLVDMMLRMKSNQITNHFPGMGSICRKDNLARNLKRMRKLFNSSYDFFPNTWCLPGDYAFLKEFAGRAKKFVLICKPVAGRQGDGIFLTASLRHLGPYDHMVCQEYIRKPFLVDGFKFDLRVYVLLLSCDPLEVLVYEEGLARFATVKYEEPHRRNMVQILSETLNLLKTGNIFGTMMQNDVFMHLTNYTINKHSDRFRTDENGSKRKLTNIMKILIATGHNVERIWKNIDELIVKTIIAGIASLQHGCRTCFPRHRNTKPCFELLGFDILLDHTLRPVLLEVNRSPSLNIDYPTDKTVKESLIRDALVHLSQCSPLKELGSRSSIDVRFRCIYPGEEDDDDIYDEFLASSLLLYTETATSRVRVTQAAKNRERQDALSAREKVEKIALRRRVLAAQTKKQDTLQMKSFSTNLAPLQPIAERKDNINLKKVTLKWEYEYEAQGCSRPRKMK